MKKIITSLVIAGMIVGGLPLASSAEGTDTQTTYHYQQRYVVNVSNGQTYNWNSWLEQFLNNYYKQIKNHTIQKEVPIVEKTEEVQVPNSETVQKPAEEQKQEPVSQPVPQPVQQQPKVAPEEQATYSLNQFEKEVVTLTNQERAKYGLEPLQVDSKLSEVARLKSSDMQQKKYFSHTSPTYGSPFDMMKQFGITYRTAGENIAMGQRSPQEVVNAWMNSEGHRKNILNSNFTHIGVGHVSSGNYWTQMFIGK